MSTSTDDGFNIPILKRFKKLFLSGHVFGHAYKNCLNYVRFDGKLPENTSSLVKNFAENFQNTFYTFCMKNNEFCINNCTY